MDPLNARIDPSEPESRLDPIEPDESTSGLLGSLRHPVVAFQRLFHIEFELKGCVLCDDDSLHGDLVELFERGTAPTARPQA